ncbi:MAG: ATP-dependent Clp protease ATP-binding subunit ClpX [Myxococcales bacterium]|nr:ATP-dependent Clp protease ATP-binding subunit ClpX [Myxococcota bacterium]MDW8283401.1 ATP-dependent Clp protease ATP-binding subunit ClpX [Myxococcales bacterium]
MRTAQRSQERVRPLLTPREIYSYLDTYIVGQERAKRTVAIAAYNHLKRCQLSPSNKRLIKKSNILLIGPTGCGKTHLARKLAECLDVPFTIADATEYTEAGYYGKDIEVMVAELLFRANHSIEECQRGIVFIDEIDKIARRCQWGRSGPTARDIGGEGVQQALLKLLEGRQIFVPLNVTQHWSKHDFVQVDTTDILFIAAGTFSDLYEYAPTRPIGFGQTSDAQQAELRIGPQQLLDYGMLAELLGRLPVQVQLQPLSEDQLLEVMTGPPDCLVREYTQLLALDAVSLHFEEEALRCIARYALSRRIGARGLRAVFEEVCHDLMFEAPERRGETLSVSSRYIEERLARL